MNVLYSPISKLIIIFLVFLMIEFLLRTNHVKDAVIDLCFCSDVSIFYANYALPTAQAKSLTNLQGCQEFTQIASYAWLVLDRKFFIKNTKKMIISLLMGLLSRKKVIGHQGKQSISTVMTKDFYSNDKRYEISA